MNHFDLKELLRAPPITGYRAFFWALLAVAIPAMLRMSLDGIIYGLAMTPFIPFVLISAIFLDPKYAAGEALASAIVADAFFIGPPPQLLEGPSDIFALIIFLAIAAMLIGFVNAVRKLVAEGDKVARHPKGIVFSQEGGEAWAGWHGRSSRVHLGQQDEVAEMMEDFLAQRELAKYLDSRLNQISADA